MQKPLDSSGSPFLMHFIGGVLSRFRESIMYSLSTIMMFGILALFLGGCASIKHKDLDYLPVDFLLQAKKPTLDVFEVRKGRMTKKKNVLLYVNGGNWNSGSKELYGFFGRHFARDGVVTVLPGYTLSPDADYEVMTQEVAAAIRWIYDHIAEYGGDPERIFLTGHSAGGHLIALAALNPKYLNGTIPIKGIILNDAAGLDMYSYLQQNPPTTEDNYDMTWSKDPKIWREASPIYFLNEDMPPFMVYLGTKTYPSIYKYNQLFLKMLQDYQPDVTPILLHKKHPQMIIQYLWPWNGRPKEIISFMDRQD